MTIDTKAIAEKRRREIRRDAIRRAIFKNRNSCTLKDCPIHGTAKSIAVPSQPLQTAENTMQVDFSIIESLTIQHCKQRTVESGAALAAFLKVMAENLISHFKSIKLKSEAMVREALKSAHAYNPNANNGAFDYHVGNMMKVVYAYHKKSITKA